MEPRVYYPKQCDEFYKYLDKGDMASAHMLWLPPVYESVESYKSRLKTEEIRLAYEAERKRIANTPNEILRIELEIKYGKQKRKKENRKEYANNRPYYSRIIQKWKSLFVRSYQED